MTSSIFQIPGRQNQYRSTPESAVFGSMQHHKLQHFSQALQRMFRVGHILHLLHVLPKGSWGVEGAVLKEVEAGKQLLNMVLCWGAAQGPSVLSLQQHIYSDKLCTLLAATHLYLTCSHTLAHAACSAQICTLPAATHLHLACSHRHAACDNTPSLQQHTCAVSLSHHNRLSQHVRPR